MNTENLECDIFLEKIIENTPMPFYSNITNTTEYNKLLNNIRTKRRNNK